MNDSSGSLVLEPPSIEVQAKPGSVRQSHVRDTDQTAIAPDWLDRGQIPGLDGLRAVAVILVMLTHSYRTAGFPHWPVLYPIAVRGYFGVDIFFVISGFLITTLLAREVERTGSVNLRRFYLRRFLRILPAYGALMVVVAALQLLGAADLQARDWIGAITYTTNFFYHPAWELGHSWSLAIEEHFYLLWPFALFAGGIAGGWRAAAIGTVGCWLIRCAIAYVASEFLSRADATYVTSMAESWTFTRLDSIAIGCLLALASRDDHCRLWLDRLAHPMLMLAYVAAIVGSLELTRRSTMYNLCIAYDVNAVCVALLMWGLIRSKGVIRNLFNSRIASTIGMASYSIYLWQQLFINPHSTGWVHAFPQSTGFVFVAAFLSYYLIEQPFNRLKDRVAR